MNLPDDVIVYPGHGAGSACGKNMSHETTSTIGFQKKFNYALKASLSKEDFIKQVTDGLVEPPQYFPKDVMLNKNGYDSIDDVIKRGTTALTLNEFETILESTNPLIIDTRSKDIFPKGFIPGSIFIGIDDKLAPWAGTLITDLKQPILFIADEGREEEVVIRLARVGIDHILGFLKGGINTWMDARNAVDTIDEITSNNFALIYNGHNDLYNLLDVRKESEYQSEHIIGAINLPLDFIYRNLSMLKKEDEYYIHCAGGYRSMIACSILKAKGYYNVINIKGGYSALSNTHLVRSEYIRPKTML